MRSPAFQQEDEFPSVILYAVFVRRFSNVALALLVALSAYFTIDICFDIDTFGFFAGRESAAYTVIGGFGLTPQQVYIGMARLLFPFFGGLLLYRLGIRIKLGNYGFLWCSLAIAAILVWPHIGGVQPNWMNGAYCAIAIMLLFPLIVSAGAGSPLEGKKTIKVCKFLGAISYPLYITHYPMIYVQMKWAADHADAPLGTHIWVAVWIFIAAIAVAYACLKLYDEPVREWIKNHWLYASKK